MNEPWQDQPPPSNVTNSMKRERCPDAYIYFLKLTEGSEQKTIKKEIKAKRVGHTENNARETKVPVNNKHHAQEAGK